MPYKKTLHCVVSVQEMVFLGLLLMVSPGLAQDEGWAPLADIPTPRALASSCILDGKAHVIGGGFNDITCTGVVEVYDIATDTWDTTKADMPTPRVEFCAAQVNGIIYAIGGGSSHDPTENFYQKVEAYYPETDSWETNFMPMGISRMGAACGVIDNKIYIAGGLSDWDPVTVLDDLRIFDPSAGSWSTGAPMPTALYACSGVVVNGLFYVIGGLTGWPWGGRRAVQVYDPVADSWTIGADMREGRVAHTVNVVGGKIYAIGGASMHIPVQSVEVYDPDLDSWRIFDQTPGVVTNHTANELGEHILVFSGSSSGQEPTPTASVYRYEPALGAELMGGVTPEWFVLSQAQPNPFTAGTTIEFALPHSGFVTLKILNMLGEEVAMPISRDLASGNYEYRWDASSHASGAYFCRLEAGEISETKKMVLVR